MVAGITDFVSSGRRLKPTLQAEARATSRGDSIKSGRITGWRLPAGPLFSDSSE